MDRAGRFFFPSTALHSQSQSPVLPGPSRTEYLTFQLQQRIVPASSRGPRPHSYLPICLPRRHPPGRFLPHRDPIQRPFDTTTSVSSYAHSALNSSPLAPAVDLRRRRRRGFPAPCPRFELPQGALMLEAPLRKPPPPSSMVADGARTGHYAGCQLRHFPCLV